MDATLLAPLLVAGIGSLLGLVFLTIGVLRGRMTRSWSRTTGVIIDRRSGTTTGTAALYPTFQWRDQHGQDHQRTSIVRATLGPAPGKLVPVLYDPVEPTRAVIDTAVQSGRVFSVIGTVIAVIALFFAAFLFLLLRTTAGL